jgi:RNA recognition motif-containing protein
LYVGNLPFQVTGSDLEQLFSEFGAVRSALVIEDRETGRSRGFGFVEMAGPAEAQAAVDGLHDREYRGRRLVVNEARPREVRAGGGYVGGGYADRDDRGRGHDVGFGGGRGRSGGYGRGGYGGRY